jgi:hypothetical protein
MGWLSSTRCRLVTGEVLMSKRIDRNARVRPVDLDAEPLHYRGRQVDESAAEELAQQILERAGRRQPGRPSLTGTATHSPQVGVRVTPDIKSRLQARADREHKSLSDVIRDAINAYV